MHAKMAEKQDEPGPRSRLKNPQPSRPALHLGGDLGLGVGDLDTHLLRAGNDVDSLSRRDVVGDPIL
jgi:hypothetical protein